MFNSSSKLEGFKEKRKWKIFQLFRATDFKSLMYPCIIFCRILGIFPYRFKASGLKNCKYGYIISVIFISSFLIYELINLYNINISKNITFKSMPRTLERNCFYIFGGSIAVATFLLRRQRLCLIQSIIELSLRLPPESYRNLSKLIHTKDIFGFFFLLVQASIYYSKMQFGILRKIFILYIILMVFQMDMLYMNCVCVLKACYKQINDNLLNLKKFIMNDEPYILKETYHEQRNPIIIMELNTLKKQHLAVSETVQMLKLIFSFQLLSTIVMTFTEITFNLYFYLMPMEEEPVSKQEQQVYYEYFVASVIFYFTKMVLIVWACETGKNQAAEIITTVFDVFNSSNDKQIKYELQLFSLQLRHRKNIFSAKGLIVDASLLTAMIGGITTYLIILIQYILKLDSCGGKPSINLQLIL